LTTSNGYTVSMDAQWIYSQWTIPSLIHPGDVLKSFLKWLQRRDFCHELFWFVSGTWL